MKKSMADLAQPMKRCHDRVVRRLTTDVVAAQNRHKRVILRNSTKLYIAAESRTLSCSEKERMVGIAKELEMFRAPEQIKAQHALYFRHQGRNILEEDQDTTYISDRGDHRHRKNSFLF